MSQEFLERWYRFYFSTDQMRTGTHFPGQFWTYIVECADGTYYTGSTNNLENRLKLHNAGNGAKYVRGRGPVTVVYKKEYGYYKRALQAERQLKKLTRRQKEELVRAKSNLGHVVAERLGYRSA